MCGEVALPHSIVCDVMTALSVFNVDFCTVCFELDK